MQYSFVSEPFSSQGIGQVFSWTGGAGLEIPQALPKATSVSSHGSVAFGSLDFSMTSHQHPLLISRVNIALCNPLCLLEKEIGSWFVYFQARCLWVFLNSSRADFTSPSAERFLWMVPWLLHWEKQEFRFFFFFSGNKSSLLIKSILNLYDFLKYYLHI